jgi:type IV pilus assembly protein PilN
VSRINLLPREERVRRRTVPKVKLPAVGAFVPLVALGVVAGSIGVTHTLKVREGAGLEAQIAQLRAESEHYKPQLARIRDITQKRQEVSNRLDIISQLDQERYFRVKLLDEVARATPEYMWLTKVQEQSSHRFAFEGVTFSNIIVAHFMQQLETAPHWQNVELSVTQQGKIDNIDVVQFGMTSGAQP